MATNSNIDSMTTILGKETVFKGNMKFSQPLKIDGKFEGTIESDGFLYIEAGAEIKADIKVGSIVVGGVVFGDIEAQDMLEMLDTGQVIGNVKAAKLKIADGVRFEGKCEMVEKADNINVFSGSTTQIKNELRES